MHLRRKSPSNRKYLRPSLEQLEDRRTLSYTALISEVASYPKPEGGLALPPIIEAAFGEDGETVEVVKLLSQNKLTVSVHKDGGKHDLTPNVSTAGALVDIDLLPDGRAIGLDSRDKLFPVTWTSGQQPTKVPFVVPLATSLTQFSRNVAFNSEGVIYSLVNANFTNPNRSQVHWVTSDGKAVPTDDFLNYPSVRLIGISARGEPIVVIDSLDNNSPIQEIRRYASSFNSYETIAQVGTAYSKLYTATVSNDGNLAAFIGESAEKEKAAHKDKAAIYFTSTSKVNPQRVIGEYGDGKLDPTERWVDLSAIPGAPPEIDSEIDINFGAFRGAVSILRGSLHISSKQHDNDRNTFKISYAAGQGLGDNTLLLTCEVQFDDLDAEVPKYEVGAPSILITSGETEVKLKNQPTKVRLQSVADVDKDGNLLVLVDDYQGGRSLAKIELARRPLLIVPGIIGSFVSNNLGDWIREVGAEPERMSIDPLILAYDSLYKSFIDAGYELNRDLFLATYDWRLPPAPVDGTNDGVISMVNPNSALSRQQFGVDYLIYWLHQAVQSWQSKHPDFELDSVDIIAHSTGGLLTRAYAQSPAYGALLAAGNIRLPKINNFVMVGVPQEGAPKAASFLDDNWMVDPGELTYKLFLRSLANAAFQKLLAGSNITFPTEFGRVPYFLRDLLAGTGYTEADFALAVRSSTYNPSIAAIKKKFIDKYVSQIRGLAATYNYLRTGTSTISPNSFESGRLANVYLMDLNARGDWIRDENEKLLYAFPIIAHGNGVDTIVALEPRVGDGSRDNLLKSIDEVAAYPEPGQKYLELQESDCSTAQSLQTSNNYLHSHPFACGDGTVPRVSLISRFGEDPRVKHVEFMTSTSQLPGNVKPPHLEMVGGPVNHVGILSNAQVVKQIAGWVGRPIFEDQVASVPLLPGLADLIVEGVSNYLAISIDPVFAELVDEQGNRTGFTKEGIKQEIPHSRYIGEQDGILLAVDESGQKQWRLELTGDGGDYYVDVDGRLGGKPVEIFLSGKLEVGQYLAVDLKSPPEDDRPFAVSEAVQLVENERMTVPILANDWIPSDGLPVKAIQLVDAPSSSEVAIDQATGTITVVAGSSNDQFSYRITDALGRISNVATVSIGVRGSSSRPPTAVPDRIVVTSDAANVKFSILDNDSNLGGPLSTLSVQLEIGSDPSFVLNSDLSISFSADPQKSGFSTARYSVTNALGLQSNSAVIQAFVVNYALARPWNNLNLAFDVNGDGLITPSDALLVINYLNSDQNRLLPTEGSTTVFGFLDVMPDGRITPSDALAIINWLNTPRPQDAEGESAGPRVASMLPSIGSTLDIALAQMYFTDDNENERRRAKVHRGS